MNTNEMLSATESNSLVAASPLTANRDPRRDRATPAARPRRGRRTLKRWLPAQFAVLALCAGASACSTTDDAEPFLGSWAYATGSTFAVTCGTNVMQLPADSLVETFITGSATDLVKNDSQGCAGQAFNVSGNVATLTNSGHSCDIPGGVYTANTATFTLSANKKSLTAALAGAFAPTQAPGTICTTSANTTLNKQ